MKRLSNLHDLGAVTRQTNLRFRVCPPQTHLRRQARCGDVLSGQLRTEQDLPVNTKRDQMRIEGRIEVGGEKQAVVDVQTLGVGFAFRPRDDMAGP